MCCERLLELCGKGNSLASLRETHFEPLPPDLIASVDLSSNDGLKNGQSSDDDSTFSEGSDSKKEKTTSLMRSNRVSPHYLSDGASRTRNIRRRKPNPEGSVDDPDDISDNEIDDNNDDDDVVCGIPSQMSESAAMKAEEARRKTEEARRKADEEEIKVFKHRRRSLKKSLSSASMSVQNVCCCILITDSSEEKRKIIDDIEVYLY